MLQDAEVVRDGDDLGFEKLGDIADGHFAVAEDIDDPQPQRFAEGFELVGAGLRLEGILIHDGSLRGNDGFAKRDRFAAAAMIVPPTRSGNSAGPSRAAGEDLPDGRAIPTTGEVDVEGRTRIASRGSRP